MDELINSSNQIFILNAAKTAGTSMKAFTDKCVGDQDSYKDGHIINNIQQIDFRKSALLDTFNPPRLITAHIWKEDGFINLMKQASKETLIIYCFRSETDRQLATMRQLISGALCRGIYTFFGSPVRTDYKSIYEIREDGTCILNEARMVELFSERRAEMDCGIYKTLTCKTYDAMQENRPNIIFVNYKQVGNLQAAIAKKHCPELQKKQFKLYDAERHPDEETVFVRLNRTTHEGKNEVPLKSWLEAKRELLEWSLHLKHDASCTGKTEYVERNLLSCPDEMLKFLYPNSL